MYKDDLRNARIQKWSSLGLCLGCLVDSVQSALTGTSVLSPLSDNLYAIQIGEFMLGIISLFSFYSATYCVDKLKFFQDFDKRLRKYDERLRKYDQERDLSLRISNDSDLLWDLGIPLDEWNAFCEVLEKDSYDA